jgi:hypothetical protein
MACERCGGLSIAAHFEEDHAWEYEGWECPSVEIVPIRLSWRIRDAQAHGTIGPRLL